MKSKTSIIALGALAIIALITYTKRNKTQIPKNAFSKNSDVFYFYDTKEKLNESLRTLKTIKNKSFHTIEITSPETNTALKTPVSESPAGLCIFDLGEGVLQNNWDLILIKEFLTETAHICHRQGAAVALVEPKVGSSVPDNLKLIFQGFAKKNKSALIEQGFSINSEATLIEATKDFFAWD